MQVSPWSQGLVGDRPWYLAAWLDGQTERELAVVMQLSLWSVGWMVFLGASCHLPTEVLSWFELVLAEILSAANSNLICYLKAVFEGKICDFFFSWIVTEVAAEVPDFLVVYHSEMCYWFCNVHGSNSSENIEQYLSSIKRTYTPTTVACPPFIDQSAPMLLAALLWAALGKHKCLPQCLLTLVA